jgi:hypothetical protein
MIEVFESTEKMGLSFRQYMIYKDKKHLISFRYNGEITEYELFSLEQIEMICKHSNRWKLSDLPDYLKALLI